MCNNNKLYTLLFSDFVDSAVSGRKVVRKIQIFLRETFCKKQLGENTGNKDKKRSPELGDLTNINILILLNV